LLGGPLFIVPERESEKAEQASRNIDSLATLHRVLYHSLEAVPWPGSGQAV